MKDFCPDCQGYGGKRVEDRYEHCEACGGLGFLDQVSIALRRSLEPLRPGETVKVYGESRQFETEGDMYEALTGHRSNVLDETGR